MTSTAVNLHARARAGRNKRAATRGRLIEVALKLCARRSPDALTIDDIVDSAGLARGTFYNYFRTVQELSQAAFDHALTTLGERVAADLAALPAPVADDPLTRLAALLRSFLHWATREPDLGWVVVRVSASALPTGTLPVQQLIRRGLRNGSFSVPSEPLAVELLTSSLVAAARATLSGRRGVRELDQATELMLQTVGAPPAAARRAVAVLSSKRT